LRDLRLVRQDFQAQETPGGRFEVRSELD